jgi:Family of unknown function (DUF6167)
VSPVRRLFWVALGAVVGVLVVHRVTKAASAFTPEGVAGSLSSLGDGLRELAGAVREGMAEREHELRVALGVDAGTLDPDQAQALLENPTREG